MRDFMKHSLLVCVSLIFAFFIVEQSVRFFSSENWSQRITSETVDELHVPRPYVMAGVDPHISPEINSLGYKGSLPTLPKPTDEFRIIVLGGSTVFGFTPRYEKDMNEKPLPKLLEEELQKKNSSIKVYNFGITSTIATQELVRLIIDVVEFKPDLVISYGGGNDFYQMDRRVGYPHRFVFYEFNPLHITDVESYPALILLAFESLTLRKIFRNQFEDYFTNNAYIRAFSAPIPSLKNSLSNYIQAQLKMDKISQAFNSKFLTVFQPLRDLHKKSLYNFKEDAKKTLSSQLSFIDLSPLSEQIKKEAWEDVVHIDRPSNELIARTMAEKMEDMNILPPIK